MKNNKNKRLVNENRKLEFLIENNNALTGVLGLEVVFRV